MSGSRRAGAAAGGHAAGGPAAHAAAAPAEAELGLVELALALEQAARQLRREAARLSAPAPSFLPPPEGELVLTAAHVRAIVAARRLRTAFLPDLSGDHAFSMLLELYAARLEDRRIPQTRLARAAGVPHATAIRILHALAAEGLVAAAGDPADRRLNLYALTDEAAGRMHDYPKAALSAVSPLV
jgi:DNA-binding MarR family transcriptional regulator